MRTLLLTVVTAALALAAALGPAAEACAQDRHEGYVRSEQPSGEMRYVYFEAIEDSLVYIREGRAEDGPAVSVSPFGFRSICSSLEAVSEPAAEVDTVSSTNVSLRDGTLRFNFARDVGYLDNWGLPLGVGLFSLLAVGLLWQTRRLRRSRRERAQEQEARRRLAEGREQERGRLAREIHDGPLQDLLALRMHLVASAPANGTTGEEGVGDSTETVHAELRRTARSLRAVSEDLRPPELEAGGLSAALRAQAARLREQFPSLDVSFEERGGGGAEEDALPPPLRLALFRIGQEAMNNAAQHAGARHVSARLRRGDDGLAATLDVTDDGRGFDAREGEGFARFAAEGHYGLLGMAERAELHGIALSVTSEPGAGAHVRASVSAEAARASEAV